MAAAAARGPPADVPEALLLALPHLDLRGLLAVEQVCRALQAAVRSDTSLWCSLALRGGTRGAPQLNDDRLATLVARSHGSLQSLLLWRCLSITSRGLAATLKDCPRLEKLHVVNCRTSMSACEVLLLAKSLAHAAEQLGLRPSLRQLRLQGSLMEQCSGTDLLELRRYMAPDAGRVSPPQSLRARAMCFWDLDLMSPNGAFNTLHNGLRELKEHDESGRAIDADTFDPRPTWRLDVGDQNLMTMCQICEVCEPCWKRLPRCIYCNQASCPYGLDQWAGKIHNKTSFLCPYCNATEYSDMPWASDNEDNIYPKDYTG
eukprot:SM000132S26884  [mRNA]  locus=s132:272615:274271:+ [translate_table: standard]